MNGALPSWALHVGVSMQLPQDQQLVTTGVSSFDIALFTLRYCEHCEQISLAIERFWRSTVKRSRCADSQYS
eukprot:690988-Amphidinium_carterae.1